MEQPGLRYCDVLYEASRRNRKMAGFSSEDVELETSDDRCMQQISRENVDEDYVEFLKLRLNVDEDYVEFLKLHYNYDRYSQSYINECGNDGCPDEVGVEDEDDLQYKMFDGNADEVDVEDEAGPQYKMFDDSSDEDEVDPQYKMFLANAKPDGKSYVVKVDTEDGSSVLIKYEKESGCDYECEHLYCEKQKDIEMQKDAVCEKNLLNISSEDEEEGQKFSRTIPGYDSNRSMGDVDVVFEPFNPVSQRKNGISSQKLSMGKHGASKRQGKCGTKTQSDEEPMMAKESKPVNFVGKRKASDVDEDYMLLLKSLQCENWESDEEPMMAKERKPVNFVGKRKASDVDEDYMLLLKSLQCENRDMKGSLGNGYSFEYEAAEDGVEILDNNIVTLKNVGSFNLTASSAKHHESVEDRYPQTSVQSEFRQKVMDLLKQPYNRNEYEELWAYVNGRKPIERNIELRNGEVKFYQTKKLGKSYLDRYKDLNKKLKRVDNDNSKKLKILRGFSFWLQHLTQAGAFRPWTDAEFLALVDESSWKVMNFKSYPSD